MKKLLFLLYIVINHSMTASCFNCVPSLLILHSKNLVNWEITNYVLRDLYPEGVYPVNFFDKE